MFFLPGLHGGGAERVAVNMLKKLDPGKFDIFLVLVSKGGEYLGLIPEYVNIIDLQAKKTMFSIWGLYKAIKKIKPNIVFSTLFRTHIALDIALKGLRNKPFVILRCPNSPRLLISNGELGSIMKKMLDLAYSHADRVVVQTPEMKEEIISHHHIDGNNVEVFINPLDTKFIEEKIANITNPFDPNDINIVAAGRLARQKGFDILIQSFQKVLGINDRFKLWIIGQEAEAGKQKELQQLTDSLNLAKNIFFLGFQKNPYRYFYYSDLYVLSSRWEGLPNTVLENLYLKKPIIATRCIPFMDTLITNGKNGLLVDVDDIDSLAQAIINYKVIDPEYKTIKFDTFEVSNIFRIEENKS
jgi:glycosyltransferase involved in cell wall biosynthesis